VVTLPDVVKGIAAQSKYEIRQNDFTPIPCCYPTCGSAAYVYMENGKATPLNRIVKVEDYLDYFKNRTVADLDEIRAALESLFSMGAVPGSDKTLSNFCAVCGVDLAGVEERVKMILVQPFMDPWNFDVKRVMKCCIHEIMPDGRIIPFCAYNNVYR
jgi:tetraether lipid synthase